MKNENITRDAIMNGELNRDECDDEDACRFLQLLKRPKGLKPDDEDDMQVNEWKKWLGERKNVAYNQHFQWGITLFANVR